VTYVRLPKPYTAAEIAALEKACDRPEVWAACMFLRETGLRTFEAVAISREQAESWVEGPAWIFRRREPLSIRIVGKGDKERVVMLSERAIEAVRVLLAVPYKKPNPGGGNIYRRTDTLFPWGPRWVRYAMKELGEKAGVHCHPHRWRHTFVQELVDSGAPIQVVADMAGHTDVNTTRIYFMSSASAKADALEGRRRFLRRR
jgi:integrase/recombinase XerD